MASNPGGGCRKLQGGTKLLQKLQETSSHRTCYRASNTDQPRLAQPILYEYQRKRDNAVVTTGHHTADRKSCLSPEVHNSSYKYPGLLTGHDPTHGSCQEVIKISRVERGRVGSGRVGSGRVGSGRVG